MAADQDGEAGSDPPGQRASTTAGRPVRSAISETGWRPPPPSHRVGSTTAEGGPLVLFTPRDGGEQDSSFPDHRKVIAVIIGLIAVALLAAYQVSTGTDDPSNPLAAPDVGDSSAGDGEQSLAGDRPVTASPDDDGRSPDGDGAGVVEPGQDDDQGLRGVDDLPGAPSTRPDRTDPDGDESSGTTTTRSTSTSASTTTDGTGSEPTTTTTSDDTTTSTTMTTTTSTTASTSQATSAPTTTTTTRATTTTTTTAIVVPPPDACEVQIMSSPARGVEVKYRELEDFASSFRFYGSSRNLLYSTTSLEDNPEDRLYKNGYHEREWDVNANPSGFDPISVYYVSAVEPEGESTLLYCDRTNP